MGKTMGTVLFVLQPNESYILEDNGDGSVCLAAKRELYFEGRKRLMKTKKLTAIVLTLILVFSLAACNSGGSKNNTDEIQGTPEVAAAPVTTPDEGNAGEDEKDAKEEEVNNDPDEPPFLKTLRTGVYGYEMRSLIFLFTDNPSPNYGFVYSDGSRAVYGMLADEEGELELFMRFIYDYEKNETCMVNDYSKTYMIMTDPNNKSMFITSGLPDFSPGQNESGRGTADCNGETLEYIDYGSGEDAVRVFMKDGDVYCVQVQESDQGFRYLEKTYSSPPTTEYFEIPDDYELDVPSR